MERKKRLSTFGFGKTHSRAASGGREGNRLEETTAFDGFWTYALSWEIPISNLIRSRPTQPVLWAFWLTFMRGMGSIFSWLLVRVIWYVFWVRSFLFLIQNRSVFPSCVFFWKQRGGYHLCICCRLALPEIWILAKLSYISTVKDQYTWVCQSSGRYCCYRSRSYCEGFHIGNLFLYKTLVVGVDPARAIGVMFFWSGLWNGVE